MGPHQLPRADSGLARVTALEDQRVSTAALASIAGCAVVGCGLLVAAYAVAAAGGGTARFVLFWAGLLVAVVPIVAALLSTRANPLQRVLLLMALGAYTSLPKLLRGPAGPVYSDELQHWRQVNDIVATGELGRMHSLLRMLGAFPGLHGATATLAELSGLQTWTVARMITIVAHLLVLVALLLLVREVTGSLRLAALTAALYTVNPSWLFFDLQFAYETLALPLAFTCLALTARAANSGGRQRRTSLLGAAGLACAVTVVHHLTALILLLVLALVAVLAHFRRRKESAGPEEIRSVVVVLLVAAVADLLWMSRHLGLLIQYLSPSITRSSRQLSALAARMVGATPPGDPTAQSHRLFSGTTLPTYEVLAGFIVPVLLLAVAGLAWRRRQELRLMNSFASGLVVLGLLYFGSLPFILTVGGSEGARRSWAWSYLGLAFIAALLSTSLADRWGQWRALYRRASGAALVLLFVVASMGGVASGQNEAYRFPGLFETGRDGRTLDLEARDVAEWLRLNVGPGEHVIADRYTGLALNAFGGQDLAAPSSGFPAWDLLISDAPPSKELLFQLGSPLPYTYLVVDRRLTEQRPQSGLWFTVDEPGRDADQLPPAGALSRYGCLPWTTPVYSSTNLTVYRIDLLAYNAADTAAAAQRCHS